MKKVMGVICFVLLFFLILQNIQIVLQAKWWNDSNTYARLRLFYQEPQPPEVVFIGSSQIYYNINPLVIFQEQGFTSYDLAAANARSEATKLYVDEAIKTYAPDVIVIDVHSFTRVSGMSGDEIGTRMQLDGLPLSVEKILTAWSFLEHNERFGFGAEYDSLLSYAFPILRHHDRWQSLDTMDFDLDQRRPYYHGAIHYHGYGTHYRTTPVSFGDYNKSVEFREDVLAETKRYFEDVLETCRKNGTALVLIKTPTETWRQDYYDLICEWAGQYGVPFIDYNDLDLMKEVGLDLETDFVNTNHLNDAGATKLSSYLGQYLADNYSLPDHRGDPSYAAWEYDWTVYQQDKASYFLSNETDWSAYLEKLDEPNYTIYLAARDNLGGNKFPELTEQLKSIGLTSELDTAAATGYLAIIDGGEVIFEQLEDAHLAWSGQIHGYSVELASESIHLGNFANIKLNGVEYGKNKRGLNIVVYDNLLEDVVDSVTFDLWGGGKAYR